MADLKPTAEDPQPGIVVLDKHEAASGAARYAIWDDGQARPVAAGAQVLAYLQHRCDQPVR